MAEEDDSQKTEEPTGRKLAKAKQKGQVSSSQEVKSWAILMGSTLTLAALSPWMMSGLAGYASMYIEHADTIPVEKATMGPLFIDMILQMGLYTAPLLAVLFVLSIVASVAQTGMIVAPAKLKPELKKISVIAGVKRMFSLRSVVEFLKGIFKLTVLSVVAYGMAFSWLGDIAVMPDFAIGEMLDRMYVVSVSLATGAIAVMTAVAVLDFAYQKFEFTKSMRMSRQEVKDEYKDTEGDPQIKARIRKIRAERAQSRMMANVPEADVVVTNPTHFAVALQYKMDDMQAPKLVAKGVDSLAFRIREVAEENEIPIVENPPLARALYAAVELDEEIPVEHYQAVAEVIGYVMKLKGKRGGTEQTIH